MTDQHATRAQHHFWQAHGQPDFGYLDAVPGISTASAPIRLQRGNTHFGAVHIQRRHGSWVLQQGSSIPELVWIKCRQPGSIHCTETSTDKAKIWLPMPPASLMVLRFVAGTFWTVVTLYPLRGRLDGRRIDRYRDSMPILPASPAFTIQPLPATPRVILRRRTPRAAPDRD